MLLPTAGIGYTLKFTGRKSIAQGEALFYSAFSDAFDVSVGDIYQLRFESYLGNAFGGAAFSSHPNVGLADRGGNIIRGIDGVEIVATLSLRPKGTELLLPSTSLAVETADGVANFTDLYIMEAGGPYQISFTATNVSERGFALFHRIMPIR